jgi:hypothetical protein
VARDLTGRLGGVGRFGRLTIGSAQQTRSWDIGPIRRASVARHPVRRISCRPHPPDPVGLAALRRVVNVTDMDAWADKLAEVWDGASMPSLQVALTGVQVVLGHLHQQVQTVDEGGVRDKGATKVWLGLLLARNLRMIHDQGHTPSEALDAAWPEQLRAIEEICQRNVVVENRAR